MAINGYSGTSYTHLAFTWHAFLMLHLEPDTDELSFDCSPNPPMHEMHPLEYSVVCATCQLIWGKSVVCQGPGPAPLPLWDIGPGNAWVPCNTHTCLGLTHLWPQRYWTKGWRGTNRSGRGLVKLSLRNWIGGIEAPFSWRRDEEGLEWNGKSGGEREREKVRPRISHPQTARPPLLAMLDGCTGTIPPSPLAARIWNGPVLLGWLSLQHPAHLPASTFNRYPGAVV